MSKQSSKKRILSIPVAAYIRKWARPRDSILESVKMRKSIQGFEQKQKLNFLRHGDISFFF